jgi:hypothetical protein
MTKWRVVGWFLRLAVKYFVRWLIREMLEELREGVFLRVVLDGKVYWLEVKLVEGVLRGNTRSVIDVG